VFIGHPGLGQLEQRVHIGYERYGFIDRKELNGVVQEEEIGMVTHVPFHLPDRLLLALAIHRAQNLLIEQPPQFRLFDDPIGIAIEGKLVIKVEWTREIAMIMI
jgi:hypothetical protein